MRVGVFGDIHADDRALKSLIADMDARGVDRIWCLGDFVFGRTAMDPGNSAECFDLTFRRAEIVLAGNWEWVNSRIWAQGEGHRGYRFGKAAFDQLGSARLERILQLQPKAEIAELGIELVHASLTEPRFDFVKDVEAAARCLNLAKQDIVILGHTHEAAYFREDVEGAVTRVRQRGSLPHRIDRRCVLNPGAGSDGQSHARWLELQIDAGETSAIWHRTDTGATGSNVSETVST